jgi:hypothetical protein
MAFTAAGSVTVNFASRAWAGFPPQTLAQGKTPLISLTANPITTTISFGYLLVIPRLTLGTTSYDRPALAKFFPNGRPLILRLPTFNKASSNQVWTVGLLPVELYRGRAKPLTVTVNMAIDTSIDEGSIPTP